MHEKHSSCPPSIATCLLLFCPIEPGVLDQMFVLAEPPHPTLLLKSAPSPASNAVLSFESSVAAALPVCLGCRPSLFALEIKE